MHVTDLNYFPYSFVQSLRYDIRLGLKVFGRDYHNIVIIYYIYKYALPRTKYN